MKTLRGLTDLSSLHDLRSISRSRRSAKPQLPTTAIIELNMARNEQNHLIEERAKLMKRMKQIDIRLSELRKDMDVLEQRALEMIRSLRGDAAMTGEIEKIRSGRAKVVLNY